MKNQNTENIKLAKALPVKKTKRAKQDPVEKLFQQLESIDFKCSPYKGLIKEVGIEAGFDDNVAARYAHRNIFGYKNYRLAILLMNKVIYIQNAAALACA